MRDENRQEFGGSLERPEDQQIHQHYDANPQNT